MRSSHPPILLVLCWAVVAAHSLPVRPLVTSSQPCAFAAPLGADLLRDFRCSRLADGGIGLCATAGNVSSIPEPVTTGERKPAAFTNASPEGLARNGVMVREYKKSAEHAAFQVNHNPASDFDCGKIRYALMGQTGENILSSHSLPEIMCHGLDCRYQVPLRFEQQAPTDIAVSFALPSRVVGKYSVDHRAAIGMLTNLECPFARAGSLKVVLPVEFVVRGFGQDRPFGFGDSDWKTPSQRNGKFIASHCFFAFCPIYPSGAGTSENSVTREAGSMSRIISDQLSEEMGKKKRG